MVKSGIIPNIEYDQARVLYISNVRQAMLYMRNGAKLLDVLYCNTKNDSLVFVFERNALAKELYEKWNNHELN
jgi:hypothetical protein